MLVIESRKALVVKSRNPQQLLSLIPTARPLHVRGQDLVAIPHRLDESKVLLNLGMRPPSPILHHYKWSGSYSPFAAQAATSAFLTFHPRAYVLNGMGSGKTLATLWAYDYLRRQNKRKKMLIVCPLSTMDRTWGDEIFRHFPHLDFQVLYGARDRRIKLFRQQADIYIINHDGLGIIADELNGRGDIDIIVVDEVAQSARNAQTVRWKLLNQVINKQCSGTRWCWGLTGTPTPNAPTDAWAQCRLITPSTVPNYFNRFKDMVMRQAGPFNWISRPDAMDVVHRCMTPSIRFSREECVDLPPCIFQTRHVPLSATQEKAYKDMVGKLHAEIQGDQITAVNQAVKVAKLVQIACIRHDARVLTCKRWWIPIADVAPDDLVWDGEEWVATEGPVLKGVRETIQLGGVHMTPDHLVLTDDGWKPAEEIPDGDACSRPGWAEVRLPHGFAPGWNDPGENEVRDMALPVGHRQRAGEEQASEVYDLINCGPRNRFVVCGSHGDCLIVHNCGVALDNNGGEVVTDAATRMAETLSVVQEADGKTIVFVPFIASVKAVAGYLRANGINAEVIYGDVPKAERDRIFFAFQNDPELRVIVAQPAAMSHGLTLVAANTMVWYAPITSNDIYDQACARITRPGQTRTQLIVNIEGTPVERKLYERLRNKQKMQGLLLSLVEADRQPTKEPK